MSKLHDDIRLEEHIEDIERTIALLTLKAARLEKEHDYGGALALKRDIDHLEGDLNRKRYLHYGMPPLTPDPQPHPSSCLGGMRHLEPATPAKR